MTDKYKVLEPFMDLEDINKHIYKVDDTYPRNGYTPNAKRIKELLGKDNKRKTALIAVVK